MSHVYPETTTTQLSPAEAGRQFAAMEPARVRTLIYGEVSTAADLADLEVIAAATGVDVELLVPATGMIGTDPRTQPLNPHAEYDPSIRLYSEDAGGLLIGHSYGDDEDLFEDLYDEFDSEIDEPGAPEFDQIKAGFFPDVVEMTRMDHLRVQRALDSLDTAADLELWLQGLVMGQDEEPTRRTGSSRKGEWPPDFLAGTEVFDGLAEVA